MEGVEDIPGSVLNEGMEWGKWSSFKEYLDLYLEILFESKEVNIELQKELINGQNNYLNYRRVNDPARPMLSNLFGKEFTESLIKEVLFTT